MYGCNHVFFTIKAGVKLLNARFHATGAYDHIHVSKQFPRSFNLHGAAVVWQVDVVPSSSKTRNTFCNTILLLESRTPTVKAACTAGSCRSKQASTSAYHRLICNSVQLIHRCYSRQDIIQRSKPMTSFANRHISLIKNQVKPWKVYSSAI